MAHYEADHTKLGTKLTHIVGIPGIVVSFPLMMLDWRWGLSLFVGGWILQGIGHRIEGNKPAFFSDPLYLLVGVAWVLKEIAGFVIPRAKRPTP